MKHLTVRTVVVGSGCAGYKAADTLAALGEKSLLLVTEDRLAGTSRNTGSDKQTYYKLSLAGDDGDSVGELARTLAGPDMHGDIALCEAASSATCFLSLAALGVHFPVNEYGEYAGYQTDHDVRKRATSAGPLTSKYMTEALEASVRARQVSMIEDGLVFRILTDADGVAGLDVFSRTKGEQIRIHCANVILCTGGPAHIYADCVYPESQHGMSGLAIAAGASMMNADCWQYGLATTKVRWNVSGSYQQAVPRYISVDAEGREREFLADALGEKEAIDMTFLKGYQWPFDTSRLAGSSRVDLLVKAECDRGNRVYLDYTKNPRGYSPEMLSREAWEYLHNCHAEQATPIERLAAMNAPAIDLYASHGIDMWKEPLEIRVCAQHHNGGIAVDADWQTDVPGLYVCGEAAGTFGYKRPGGSALNATQVGALRAAGHAMRNGRQPREHAAMDEPFLCPVGDCRLWQQRMTRAAGIERDVPEMEKMLQDIETALNAATAADPSDADFEQRVLLGDILLTQHEVLSAMILGAGEETHEGVLVTRQGKSFREAARPIPDRDLWFESVWKNYLEREGR
ncbi:MAG: FAD-binding protein [Clostridia bacterium]|nr:FAD-binding protein [Clostridia bacterium]